MSEFKRGDRKRMKWPNEVICYYPPGSFCAMEVAEELYNKDFIQQRYVIAKTRSHEKMSECIRDMAYIIDVAIKQSDKNNFVLPSYAEEGSRYCGFCTASPDVGHYAHCAYWHMKKKLTKYATLIEEIG